MAVVDMKSCLKAKVNKMIINNEVLRNDEKAVFALRALYGQYGYKQYKMSKFEEYDLYANNKDFLVSDNVITFTDTDGKLLALKPDVTLSIIKNGKDNPDDVTKVFYNENVYRLSKGTKSFKEIMQVGLECFGNIDEYAVTEVLFLASKSLKSLSNDYVLDLSSLDVVKGVMDELNLKESVQKELLGYFGEKNVQAVKMVCELENVCADGEEVLVKLVSSYGAPEKVLSAIKALNISEKIKLTIEKFEKLTLNLKELGAENINVDFSVVNDMNYYNGIVFKGFIKGIPTGILSGGQYDNLMGKMGKKSHAIGFAVYLDELSRFYESQEYDVDVAIEYGDAGVDKVNALVKELTKENKAIFVAKKINEKLKYKELIKID